MYCRKRGINSLLPYKYVPETEIIIIIIIIKSAGVTSWVNSEYMSRVSDIF
jgi:hypothetical protein